MADQHTYSENLEIIRTGIYGTDVRQAIVEALGQTEGRDAALFRETQGKLQGAVSTFNNKYTTMQNTINNRELFIDMEQISGSTGDYTMVVRNANELVSVDSPT